MATIDLKGLLTKLTADYDQRYGQGLGAMKGAADLFGPSYMKGAESGALATMEQSMVGRGLSGTTVPGALSVGIKQQFEDVRKTKLSDALTNIGKYIQGGTPTAGTLSHLATGGFGGLLEEKKLRAALNQPRSIISGGNSGGSISGGSTPAYGSGPIPSVSKLPGMFRSSASGAYGRGRAGLGR